MTTTIQAVLIGDLRCLLCGRTAATARVIDGRTHIKVTRPECSELVRRLRCPTCGGNLQLVDTAYEITHHFYLTPADLVPKRGRPPRPMPTGVRA